MDVGFRRHLCSSLTRDKVFVYFYIQSQYTVKMLNETLYSTICASWFQSKYQGKSIFFQSLFTNSCHVCKHPECKVIQIASFLGLS